MSLRNGNSQSQAQSGSTSPKKDWRHAGAPDDRNNNGGAAGGCAGGGGSSVPLPAQMVKEVKDAINKYSSTKTTAQIILDLGITVSHVFTVVAMLQLKRRDTLWIVITALLLLTVVLQVILALVLIMLRLMGNENKAIPVRAEMLNNIIFWMCALVATLEISIAGIEKFGLDGFVDIVNGTKVCGK